MTPEGSVTLRFFGDCRIQLVDKNEQKNTTYCGQLFEILLNATEPSVLADTQKGEVLRLLAEGMPVAHLARQFGTTRRTIMRVRISLEQELQTL